MPPSRQRGAHPAERWSSRGSCTDRAPRTCRPNRTGRSRQFERDRAPQLPLAVRGASRSMVSTDRPRACSADRSRRFSAGVQLARRGDTIIDCERRLGRPVSPATPPLQGRQDGIAHPLASFEHLDGVGFLALTRQGERRGVAGRLRSALRAGDIAKRRSRRRRRARAPLRR